MSALPPAQAPSEIKLTPSDGAAFHQFGTSVSLDGERALVGAPGRTSFPIPGVDLAGSAYVFERAAGGSWDEVAILKASDGAAHDHFGFAVALSGDRAIVGARQDDDLGSDSGSAYVFERNGAGLWVQSGKLTASDGEAEGRFGDAVALDGDRAMIGAPPENSVTPGAVYVFERNAAGVWIEVDRLTAPDAAPFDRFGVSISLEGDRAVIGSQGDDHAGFLSGSAYVFERDGTGAWAQTQKLTAADAAAFDQFGLSVSLSGGWILVGSPGDDDLGSGSGSVYAFARDGVGIWLQLQKLSASDGTVNDSFARVSIAGSRALIGASGDDDGGSRSGAAYLFERDASGTWSEVDKLTASDGATGDSFGVAVSSTEDRSLVGAFFDSDLGDRSGSAYVFESVDTTPPQILSVVADPNILWPPNHKMVDVAVAVTAIDLVDDTVDSRIIGVASNEPADGTGDGDTAPDWEVTGDLTLRLRAERAGSGEGRIYTITVESSDDAGNAATAEVTVSVPESRKPAPPKRPDSSDSGARPATAR